MTLCKKLSALIPTLALSALAMGSLGLPAAAVANDAPPPSSAPGGENAGSQLITIRGPVARTVPSSFAHRSHTAFTIAPVARWITPFSGPSQRS